MKQLIKVALSGFLLLSTLNVGLSQNGIVDGYPIGCGDLHIGLSPTPIFLQQFGEQEVLKGDNYKNGVAPATELCVNTANFITIQYDGIVNFNQTTLKGDDSKGLSSISEDAVVRIIAVPRDEVNESTSNLFDCAPLEDGENGITRFERPIRKRPVVFSTTGLKESNNKASDSENIIVIGEVPVSDLRQQRILYGGLEFVGAQAIDMMATFLVGDGWPIATINSGVYIGVIDLSVLDEDTDYALVAYVCDEGGNELCNVFQEVEAKGDNSKNDNGSNPNDINGALFAAIPFSTFEAGNCPEFALDPTFADPCSCGDPLNGYVGGELALYYDVITITDSPGETWRIAAPNTEFYLNVEGTMVATASTELVYSPMDGTYSLEIWHTPGIGWDASVVRDSDGFQFVESNSCGVDVCPLIPTMGQWSLFILGLILSSIAVVFVGYKQRNIA